MEHREKISRRHTQTRPPRLARMAGWRRQTLTVIFNHEEHEGHEEFKAKDRLRGENAPYKRENKLACFSFVRSLLGFDQQLSGPPACRQASLSDPNLDLVSLVASIHKLWLMLTAHLSKIKKDQPNR